MKKIKIKYNSDSRMFMNLLENFISILLKKRYRILTRPRAKVINLRFFPPI